MNQLTALAPSIFRANVFGQWVVTHSLDDSDFHGHVLAVTTHQHLLWNLKWADIYLAFYHDVRFIPHRLSCLPWQAHYERILHSMDEFKLKKLTQSHPFKVWESVTVISTTNSLIISFTWWNCILSLSCYPRGNFDRNQLLESSISLSPLYTTLTNNLHVSTAENFHQSFLWLHPGHV